MSLRAAAILQLAQKFLFECTDWRKEIGRREDRKLANPHVPLRATAIAVQKRTGDDARSGAYLRKESHCGRRKRITHGSGAERRRMSEGRSKAAKHGIVHLGFVGKSVPDHRRDLPLRRGQPFGSQMTVVRWFVSKCVFSASQAFFSHMSITGRPALLQIHLPSRNRGKHELNPRPRAVSFEQPRSFGHRSFRLAGGLAGQKDRSLHGGAQMVGKMMGWRGVSPINP